MLSLDAALDSSELFAPLFPTATWWTWRTLIRAAEASPPREGDLEIFRELTGRSTWPSEPVVEWWTGAGRRSGKTRAMALLAVHRAAFFDYAPYLASGERASVMLLATDRTQARVAMRYVRGLLRAVPMLQKLIERETGSQVDLTNRVSIEIHTACYRATRGYTLAAVVCDEVAFWRDDSSANPADEIINALRPGLATIPGAPLLAISSTYARTGPLWQAHARHFGRDGDPILYVKAPTRVLNPTVPQALIDRALEEDPEAARAEYLADFRSDVSGYLAREVAEACTIPGRHELPPVSSITYRAFCDPSGGSSDSMTLGIAHVEWSGDAKIGVLDAIREARPPFSPDSVVRDFAELLKSYRVRDVEGDRYGGAWPAERFAVHGIIYKPAERTKSELYKESLPLLNAGRVELLDLPRLRAQLLGLERRTARGGRDTIHPAPGLHDDVANAAAGVLVLVLGKSKQRRAGTWGRKPIDDDPEPVVRGSLRAVEHPGSGFGRAR